jgi:Beta protein
MNFGSGHYVPVLKIKRGEKKALRNIAPSLRSRIIPLLEVVERPEDKSPSVDAHIENAFRDLAESVSSYPRCFIDLREIAPDGPQVASDIFARATDANIVFTPVTGISRTADVAAALEHRAHGLGLRLTREELETGNLSTDIDGFLNSHNLTPNEIDLIMDLGPVEDLIVDGIRAFTDVFLSEVPHHSLWRTFTLSACSFPVSMGIVDQHSHELVERAEWLAWKDLYTRRHQLERMPTFGDAAIQHPVGVEGFDPTIMQVSATVRYTLPDHWLLIKGQSTRSVPPITQFPILATRLVYGHLKSHFAGHNHCAGCAGIKASADGVASGLGSAEAWRRLGTIHHLSVTTLGLQTLPVP